MPRRRSECNSSDEEEDGGTARKRAQKRNMRKLRDRKERKFYTDDWVGEADDEIEGPQSFDLEDKLASERFNKPLVKEMRGQDFNLAYIQKHGFVTPFLFKDKTGLGIRVPGPDFSVSDVKACVGSKRLLDVMDVRTQKNFELTMKQWQEYYDHPERDRLLNVISLEFSHTKLENYVESPTVVRQLDWVDRVWPRHLKNLQTEATNVMDEMMYPKVQKYCLMSVKGCYTDFHVDFGGTSVWYHILKGAKIFWLIPPTDKNLELYQAWVLSGKQGDTFFGDNVEDCGRVLLKGGDTFFIPSGWIHAVYTPADSLVFGGNFLHSFGIDKQLKIATVEEQTKVPQKFRYPFFTEMLWYTLERYVHCLLGRTYIRIPDEEDANGDKIPKAQQPVSIKPAQVHLSPQELLGLKAIVMYLHQLPIARKNVPALIYDPVALLREIRTIVEEHRNDILEKAVTGKPILVWPGERAEDVGKVQQTQRKRPYKVASQGNGSNSAGGNILVHGSYQDDEPLRKRIRCGRCQSCSTKEDCKQCYVCAGAKTAKDKTHAPRLCQMRECLMPNLPYDSCCNICGLDGWGEKPVLTASGVPLKARVSQSNLMECMLCSQITHPVCLASKIATIGIVNEDLPNSWECPLCVEKTQSPKTTKKGKPNDSRRASVETTILGGSAKSDGGRYNDGHISGGSQGSASTDPIVKEGSLDITVKTEKEEFTFDESKSKQVVDKKMREDEKVVHQKMALAVRRKSVEEGLGKTKTKPVQDSSKTKPNCSTETTESGNKKPVSNESKKTEDSKNKKVDPESGQKNGHSKPKTKEPEPDSEDESEEEEKKPKISPIKYPFRTDLSLKIMNGSAKSLKRPFQIVRPAVVDEEHGGKKKKKIEPWKDSNVMLKIFGKLDVVSLNRCLQVCKDWNRIGMTPSLWRRLDFSQYKITAELLKGCVRRQPTALLLNWTSVSKQQLIWVINRLPQLEELYVQGVPLSSVIALKTCLGTTLTTLDLGYVGGLTDSALREILAPSPDARPNLSDSKSRLRNLKCLILAGASLSDVALRYVTQHAGTVAKLDLSTCSRITDAGIAQLGAPDSPSLEHLTHLNVSGCPQLTNISLDHLRRCRNLKHLDIRNIPGITIAGLNRFLSIVNTGAAGTKVIVDSDHKLVPMNYIMARQANTNGSSSALPSLSSSNTNNSPVKVGLDTY